MWEYPGRSGVLQRHGNQQLGARRVLNDFANDLERQIPALRRYAYALTRDREAADDLVQDCLERALARRRLRRENGELRAWLFTILRNRFIDTYRRDRRNRGHAPLSHADAVPIAPAQESGLAIGDIMTALDQLPEEQRSLLLLIGVEDLSYTQAAQVFDVPVGTIMSRLSRARERLRAVLEGGRTSHLRRVK